MRIRYYRSFKSFLLAAWFFWDCFIWLGVDRRLVWFRTRGSIDILITWTIIIVSLKLVINIISQPPRRWKFAFDQRTLEMTYNLKEKTLVNKQTGPHLVQRQNIFWFKLFLKKTNFWKILLYLKENTFEKTSVPKRKHFWTKILYLKEKMFKLK